MYTLAAAQVTAIHNTTATVALDVLDFDRRAFERVDVEVALDVETRPLVGIARAADQGAVPAELERFVRQVHASICWRVERARARALRDAPA